MPEMKTLTVGGVTFRIADADAVKYVPQTPTAPEQEQAQKNINVKNLTVLVSDIEGGHRLVFIDVNGPHVVDLMDGKDGFSPTAKVERTETGVRISITDKEGTTIAEVKDSQNGEGGTVDLTGYATEQWVKDGYQPKGNYALKSEIPSVPVQSVNGKTGAVQLGAADVSADPAGTAAAAVSQHNTSEDAHNDIRLELQAINNRLTAFFDSDDQTLDELSEIVAYITSNKTLIEAITTSKVSVTDIVNNLTSSVANKPLSAAQGVVLKGLIDGVDAKFSSYALASAIPSKVSQLENDAKYLKEADKAGLINEVIAALPVYNGEVIT